MLSLYSILSTDEENFGKNGIHVEPINKNTSKKMCVCNTLTSFSENAD